MSESPSASAPAQMVQLTIGAWLAQAVSVAARLGVADELVTGPRSVDELAKSTGTDASTLYRLLRALGSADVFRELDGRRFKLTPLSDLLRTDVPGSMRSWATFIGLPFHRTAWTHLIDSVYTGESAFDSVHGRTMFDHFGDHPDDAEMMDAAMTSVTSQLIVPVVEAYDFGCFGTVVDVGGGRGALLTAILAANPGVRGVLFDLPHVIAGAEPLLAQGGLGDRCQCTSGDFFDSVPPGGDAYLLSNIVHDWDDERAVQILANCRAAMGDNGRVLLAEWVLPDRPGDDDPVLPLWADLEMLVMTSGGRQRTEPEFDRLLDRAGLRLSRIVPTSDLCSIVEATPV